MLNATQAYIKAGYSPKNAHRDSSTLLRQNPAIRAHVEALFAEKALSRDQVLALVTEDAMRTNEDIHKEANRFGSEIVQSSFVSGLMNARNTQRTNLMKAHGMFTENIAVSGSLRREFVIVDGDDE